MTHDEPMGCTPRACEAALGFERVALVAVLAVLAIALIGWVLG